MQVKACPYTMQVGIKRSALTQRDETVVNYGPCIGPQCSLFIVEQDDQGQPVKDPHGGVIGGCAHVISAIAAARTAEFLTETDDGDDASAKPN